MSILVPIVTTTLGVPPQLAEKICTGLDSGAFERIGGVIRDASTKRVVTFLRDVAPSGSLSPTPLNAIGPLLRMNAADVRTAASLSWSF